MVDMIQEGRGGGWDKGEKCGTVFTELFLAAEFGCGCLRKRNL